MAFNIFSASFRTSLVSLHTDTNEIVRRIVTLLKHIARVLLMNGYEVYWSLPFILCNISFHLKSFLSLAKACPFWATFNALSHRNIEWHRCLYWNQGSFKNFYLLHHNFDIFLTHDIFRDCSSRSLLSLMINPNWMPFS